MFDGLDDWRRLSALAEIGDMATAAERLGITRNALSKALIRLEESCGVPLFERLPEGRVSPTPLGGEVLEDIKQMLQQSEVLQKKVGLARSAAAQDEAAGVKFSLAHSGARQRPAGRAPGVACQDAGGRVWPEGVQKRLVRPRDARGDGPGRGRAARPVQGGGRGEDVGSGTEKTHALLFGGRMPAAPCGPPARDLQRCLPA